MADFRPPGRPGPKRTTRPAPSAAKVDDWSDRDYEDAGFWKTRWHKRQVRRRRTKIRVAAMTRGRRYTRRAMILSTWALGLFAALIVVAVVLFYTLTNVPRPEDLAVRQVATIEYSDGSTLARIGSVDRTVVSLDQVPPHVRWAVLAAEDRNFYQNSAISIRGTVRAAWSNVTGGDTQGGSGITQQYVRNAYANVGTERTLTRKLKELMISVKLSREYSKDKILEYYLNTVYFGRGAYGIQAAAQAFFGVDVGKLTVAQGAVLAGMLRDPGYYDPAVNLTAAQGRWHYVTDGMVTTHHLSAASEAALTYPKTIKPRSTDIGVYGWKYLLKNAVMAELATKGISAEEVAARGLTIRTTIDKKAQSAALSAIRDNFDNLTEKQRNLKNALVAIDPSSGGMLAYYGGSGPDVKGYDGKVDFNDYAGRGGRPPGSTMKPYVLATALTDTVTQAEGKVHYTIASKVDGSQCLEIEGTKICNDPGDKSVSSSSVKLSNAMKYSLNTPFDELASELGPETVATTAHNMGVALRDSNGKPTLVDAKGQTTFGIGIGDYPISVVDQANGYATLQNKGMRNDAHLVSRATASDGDVMYEFKSKATRALDARVANDTTLTLRPIAGYNKLGLADGRESAAKTGTAGLSGRSAANSDAWMVGFTPQVSAAVWVGTGYSRPIYNSAGNSMYGRDLPGRTWRDFMDRYLAGKKKMSMADERQIASDGNTPAPTPTFTPTTSAPTTPSDTPTTGTPTKTETTTAPTKTHTSEPTKTRTSSPPKPPSPSLTETCQPLKPCTTPTPGG